MAYSKKRKNTSAENIDALYLEENHPAFKEIFDNANDAMLALHNDGVVHCYVNRSACEMTGYNFSELMGLGFKDLVHPEELPKIDDRFGKRRKGEDLPGCYETRIVSKNGEVIPVEVTVTMCRKDKNGPSFAILRDIRKEKHLENEMSQSLNMLKEELVKNRSEWESLNRELVQTHQAMSVLAKNIDSKKVELEEKVNTTITSKVMPIIKELQNEKRIKRFWPEINSMAEYLNSITTKNELYLKIISVLTETEMKIAAMVKNKMSSKEIASVMYISLETVKAHRKNIRRKLKIHNTKHKLSEYLATVMGNNGEQ
ncbi:MAG: PAS domain S-box protein [Desulfobacteraceae bacterium]|nr:PAS domain S-box protein [Desulfobacteraceae bacterium]